MPSLATAQQPHPAAVGDLMTALVQPRHIKLGLAGNEQNWPYAAYELDQLRETFADLAEILPKYRDLSIPDLITSTVKEPLVAVDRAIQAKDGNQFAAAYGQLTKSCNSCHQVAQAGRGAGARTLALDYRPLPSTPSRRRWRTLLRASVSCWRAVLPRAGLPSAETAPGWVGDRPGGIVRDAGIPLPGYLT